MKYRYFLKGLFNYICGAIDWFEEMMVRLNEKICFKLLHNSTKTFDTGHPCLVHLLYLGMLEGGSGLWLEARENN